MFSTCLVFLIGYLFLVFLVPKLCLGTGIVKLRFIQETELQQSGFPSGSLGIRKKQRSQKNKKRIGIADPLHNLYTTFTEYTQPAE